MLSERDSSDNSMMPQQESKAAPKPGLMTRLREEIHPAHSDLPVLATCFVSGICDSVAFNASSVFVSMQTGKSTSHPWTHWQVCHRLDPTDMSFRQHNLPRPRHSEPALRRGDTLAQGARFHRLLLGRLLLLQPITPCRCQSQSDSGRIVFHPVRLHSYRRGGGPGWHGPCVWYEVPRHRSGAREACEL